MPSAPRSSQESRFVIAELHRITGKRYPHLEAVVEKAGPVELRELVSLVHDLNGEIQKAKRNAILQPWRR